MKTNTMLHRYLALFLGIVMLWSMLPLSVSAAKEMFLTNEVSAVSLFDITAPAAQSKPDMTAECVRGDRYKVIDVFWTPSVSFGDKVITIDADEFFDFNRQYTVHVILEAVGDHYFKTKEGRLSDTKASVNNMEATAAVAPYEYLYASGYDYEVQHTKLLEVTYTFPATATAQTVDHVDLTIDPPVAGEKVQTKDMYFSDEMIGKVRYEHQQGFMKLGWYHNGTEMKPDDTFVYGEEYLATVYLCTYNDSVRFAVDHENLLFGLPNTAVKATVNGETATSVLPNNQSGTAETHITVGMLFTCEERQQIKNVDIIGIAAPVTGEAADYTADLGSALYQLQDKNNTAIKNGIYWTVKDENNVSQHDILVDDSIFEENTIYAVTVKVVPSDNAYVFASDVKVTFNGKTADNVIIDPEELRISYTFPATEKTPVEVIDQIDISGIAQPIAGKEADYDAIPGDKTYQMKDEDGIFVKNGIVWCTMDVNHGPTGDLTVADGMFEANMIYAVTVKIVPQDENHVFADNAKVTINGKTAVNVTITPNEITAMYIFPVIEAKPIEKVTVKGIDLDPGNAELPLNSNVKITPDAVSVTEFLWDTLPASNWRYGMADIMLTAEEGYAFTDDTVVTVNGYYVQKAYISQDGKEAVYRCTFAPVFKEDPKLHEHQFAYGNTPYEHWLECDCGESASFGGHEMDKNNRCQVCGFKIYDISTLPFTDVKTNDYFAQAVGWAFENNITAGTSDTTFSPDMMCTRAQVVTFLWRAAGCPEPTTTKNPFKDVKKTDWYYKAVLWAVEQNITVGTSKTEFSPDMECSTAIILTFLFRAVGAGDNGWYEEAAAWAESLDIVYITGLTVDPVTPCPRKAIVSFLYSIYG